MSIGEDGIEKMDVLHFRHGERTGTGASGASSQRPCPGNSTSVCGAVERKCVARWRSRFDSHAKAATHLPAEITAQGERTALGLSGSKARRVRGEGEIRDGDRAVAIHA